MRTRSILVGIVFLSLAVVGWRWVRLYPGPVVQDALTDYAPGLTLGGRVPTASTRYDLRIAPYHGYRDSAFVAPLELHDLRIRVNRYVDDSHRTIPRSARIVDVSLRSPDARRTAAVEADFVRRFGAPEVRCYPTYAGRSFRSAYWPGWFGRGVEVLVSRGSTAVAPAFETEMVAGAAVVTFGRERTSVESERSEPCR